MGITTINDTNLTNIANAIRSKNGTTTKYKPSEMANAISEISVSEDLNEKLTTQDTLITSQETKLDNIIIALQGKSAGGSGEISLQEKTITPTTSKQSVVADANYNGLSKVIVNGVTSAIDSDIKSTNIKKGVEILGVTGTLEEYVEPTLQSKTATPKTSSQNITADSGYDGLSKVTINAVTSSIDSNIKATNIKKGVSILGVTGTLQEGITPSGTLDITENGTHNVTNYANVNVNVASSGDTSQEDALLNGEIVNYSNSRITKVTEFAFCSRYNLETVDIPNVVEIGSSAFMSCMELTSINCPKVTTINTSGFDFCCNLSSIELPNVTYIGSFAFSSCYSLNKLILRGSTVCQLDTYALDYTSIYDGTGYIYVPDNLVNAYKTATNWSEYASQIKGVSEL